ncbi:MAG: helix-turn-helix transcriptional regulator [Erythrobacter sp.]|uniref:helix-turn-helix transcriptional regulator n=1 Tax=Erythrobacter sp. TaxID=1042 RepID=UPI003A85903A
MIYEDIATRNPLNKPGPVQIIRHAKVCEKLNVSSAKLFDMIAKGQFPRPFTIIPGGRAVGWLEADVDAWIVERSRTEGDAACSGQ